MSMMRRYQEGEPMTAKGIERAAYAAAHRIVDANRMPTVLVCPRTRGLRSVDAIADIIREVFERHSVENNEGIGHGAGLGLHVANRRRGAVVLQLPPPVYPNEVA